MFLARFIVFIICLAPVCSMSAQEIMGKALVQDELHGLFKQRILGADDHNITSEGAQDVLNPGFTQADLLKIFNQNRKTHQSQHTLTYKNLCVALLDIYHLAHKACSIDQRYIAETLI